MPRQKKRPKKSKVKFASKNSNVYTYTIIIISELKMYDTPLKMLKSIGVPNTKNFTPKKKNLHGLVRRLSKILKRTSAAKQSFGQRLFHVERFVNENALNTKISELNALAAQFINF